MWLNSLQWSNQRGELLGNRLCVSQPWHCEMNTMTTDNTGLRCALHNCLAQQFGASHFCLLVAYLVGLSWQYLSLSVICALFGRDGSSFTPVMFDSQSFTIVFDCLPLSPTEAKLSHWWGARRGKFSFSAGTEARARSTICHQLVIWVETPVWVAAGFKNLLLHLAACPVLNNGQCWKLHSLLWKRR